MTEKQPKALQLADEVDEVAQTYPDMAEVSAELRHLHTENQELVVQLADYASAVEHLLLCSHEDGDEILRLREENERLEALNQKLQEACKRFIGSLGVMIGDPDSDGDILFARKVLKETEGETK